MKWWRKTEPTDEASLKRLSVIINHFSGDLKGTPEPQVGNHWCGQGQILIELLEEFVFICVCAAWVSMELWEVINRSEISPCQELTTLLHWAKRRLYIPRNTWNSITVNRRDTSESADTPHQRTGSSQLKRPFSLQQTPEQQLYSLTNTMRCA